MTTNRHISAKKAWARLSERAQLGEKFGFIACLGILYKAGMLSRGEVLKRLNEARVTRADLVKFREQSGNRQSGPVCEGIGADRLRRTGAEARMPHQESAKADAGLPKDAGAHVLELPLRP